MSELLGFATQGKQTLKDITSAFWTSTLESWSVRPLSFWNHSSKEISPTPRGPSEPDDSLCSSGRGLQLFSCELSAFSTTQSTFTPNSPTTPIDPNSETGKF